VIGLKPSSPRYRREAQPAFALRASRPQPELARLALDILSDFQQLLHESFLSKMGHQKHSKDHPKKQKGKLADEVYPDDGRNSSRARKSTEKAKHRDPKHEKR